MNKIINHSYNFFKYNNNINCLYNLFKNTNINDWHKYKINNPNNYEKNIIFKNNEFELILISWAENATTNYHNHPKNGCILKVLEGKLKENNKIIFPGHVGINYHTDYHKIKSLKKSYTLHLYSPPDFYK